mgnify:CR=1 FL=1
MVDVSWLVVAAPGPVLDDATVIQLDPQNQGFCVLDLKKPCVALLKIREWSLISSEGFRPSPWHDDVLSRLLL